MMGSAAGCDQGGDGLSKVLLDQQECSGVLAVYGASSSTAKDISQTAVHVTKKNVEKNTKATIRTDKMVGFFKPAI